MEICDGSEESSVGITTDIQLGALNIDDLRQSINRRKLLCFFDQFNKQILFHDISIHEDVAVFSSATVALNRENTFLLVQV